MTYKNKGPPQRSSIMRQMESLLLSYLVNSWMAFTIVSP